MRHSRLLALVVGALCGVGCSHQRMAPPTVKAAEVVPPPAASPAEMQAAFKRASMPGAQHAQLAKLAGTWSAKVSWWMDPRAKPEVSKAVTVNTPIFGGRYIRESYRGKFMGKGFEGLGYLGYDTVAGEYTSSWIDSLSTASMHQTGSYDAATKSWSFVGSASCPATKGKQAMRSVIRLVDKNHYIFEMYKVGSDGSEAKSLEIVYTRTK